jgi:hypothetical protein
MSLGRLLGYLAFIFAVAAAGFGVVHLLTRHAHDERVEAAEACTPAQLAKVDWKSCWIEQPATVAEISDGKWHRVTVTTQWNNTATKASFAVDDDGAARLHVGDVVKARMMDWEVLVLSAGGVEIGPADSFARDGGDLALSTGVFLLAAVLIGLHLARHRARPGGAIDGLGAMLALFGLIMAVGFPILAATRKGEAQRYADAPACTGAEQPDCRFAATGQVVDMQCQHPSFGAGPSCYLTFAIDGAPVPERRLGSLEKRRAETVRAAGGHVRLELFHGAVTRIEVGGRPVTVLGMPSQAISGLGGAAGVGGALLAFGIYRLVRHARARRGA